MIPIGLKDNNLVVNNQIITWDQACKRVFIYGQKDIVLHLEEIFKKLLSTWVFNNGAALMCSDAMFKHIKQKSVSASSTTFIPPDLWTNLDVWEDYDLTEIRNRFGPYISMYRQYIFMYCSLVFKKIKADYDGYQKEFWAIRELWKYSRVAGCPVFTFCIGLPSECLNVFLYSAAIHICLDDCEANPSNVKIIRCY